MDQIKIGKFIARCRKDKGLTQLQLAEKLGITDRAVSKWENGKGMPDASLMLELCEELQISVNELLCGEVMEIKNYSEKAEQQLLELVREREMKDRQLLHIEVFIGVLVSAVLLACEFVASCVPMDAVWRVVLITAGFAPFVIGIGYAIRIEQVAGFYACQKCGHKYVPAYAQTLFAMHCGRTRYMKCPKCGKKSWCKKTVN